MDPVGPWSAYAASYNRLATGSFQNGQDLHGGPVQPPPTTSQLLFHANSGFGNTASPFNHNGFLSPPPVAYDSVFSPLYQKAHYRPIKQPEEYNNYENNSNWTQNNQLPSPFGILPHESVVPKYDNYNFPQPYNQYDPKKQPYESNYKPEHPKFQNLQPCTAMKEYKIPQPPRQFSRTERPKLAEPRENNSQSSPISFAMMDGQRNYQPHKLRPHYLNQQSYSPSSTAADCAGVKRPSPIHQHSPSQPSPVYPLYNSPMTSISSPSPVQHDMCYNKEPPIDATIPRSLNYQSVITRNEKNYPERFDRLDYNKWEERRRFNYESQTQRQPYIEPQVPLQDLSSCRGDPMSLVKTLQQQQPEKTPEDKQKRRKSVEKQDDYYSRIPPPAHHNGTVPNQNGYYEFERWNIPGKMFSNSPATFGPQPIPSFPNTQANIVVPPIPYYTAFHVPTQHAEPNPEKPEPKVPSIEEELSFLSDENFPWDNIKDKKVLAPNTKANFMSSYVKFLQGDKDASPPPNPRPIPRAAYFETSRVPKPLPTSNNFPSDPQDDPRYFPLPKSSKERNLNSNSEWSEDYVSAKNENDKNDKKKDDDPKSGKKKKKRRKKRMKRKVNEDDVPLPRRESSKRKAKDKLVNLQEENEEGDFPFSDLDPAWSPDSSDEDDIVLTKRKRNHTKKKSKNKKEKTEEDNTSDKDKTVDKIVIKKPHAVVSPMPSTPVKSHAQFPFNVGDFVVLKNDMILANPPIWRVKEKAMLQKFTHFVKNGVLFYMNLPCFTGWSPESKNVYEQVNVKNVSQTKHECVVQMTSTGLHVITSGRDIIAESVEENSKYRENFEVYIQTLFSQALDSTFLSEIFQEKDEYFLENVRVIDAFTNELLSRLKEALDWPRVVAETSSRLPSYRIVQGPNSSSKCICGVSGGACGVMLCGTPYHPDTLNPTDENIPSLETPLCQTCIQYFEVLHKLCHQKCSLYAVCTDRVNEKRSIDFDKDTTVLLNELLADDVWLAEIFKLTRSFWGYVEKIIYDIQRIKKSKEFSS